MTANALPPFRLGPTNRDAIIDRIRYLPNGWIVRAGPPPRSSDQNRLMHDLFGQIAKAKPEWAGIPMDAESWKALLVVSHAAATAEGGVRLVPDLEGSGLVQLRESTATMSKARASSLIEYVTAWAVQNGIALTRNDGEQQ